MRKLFNYIIGLVSLAVMTACAPEKLTASFQSGEGMLKLSFTLEDPNSRVVNESVINTSEIEIDRVDIFFYKKNEDSYTYLFQANNVTPSEMSPNNTDGHKHYECTAQITIPSGVEFNGDTYKIYVVANSNVATDNLTDKLVSPHTNVENLKALSFKSSIETLINGETRFIMDGEKDVTINNKNEVSDEIVLTRVAAKIVLDLSVYAELEASDKIYTPIFKDASEKSLIKVSFHNGVKTVNYQTPEVFNTEQWIGDAGTKEDNLNLYPIAIDPFYTYPVEWEMSNENEPYLMLEIPWGLSDGDEKDYETYYYRIPVNRKFMNADNTKLCLERNNMYKISINIGVLGSTDPNAPAMINNAKYSIMDWGLIPINTEIRDYKYLVVDQKEISIYNVADAQITFASSNDVTARIDSIAYYNYAEATTRRINIDNQGRKRVRTGDTYSNFTNTNNKDQNLYTHYLLADDETTTKAQTVEITKNAGMVDFSHTILTDTYVPHDIYITIKHVDDNTGKYEEKVKITQYPPIYIVGAKSNGYVFVNEQTSNDAGYRSSVTNDKNNNIGSVRGYNALSDAGDANNNKNQYNIHVTVAPSDYYLIGDPRVSEPEKIANIYELNETGSMYRPSRNDAVNIIAPIFKIASSYGKTTSVSYNEAKERCASYQENGYPAGRWRIPTQAEFEFIIQRSYNNDIPSLFDDGYYVADGKVYDGNNFVNSNSENYVRCVYDVWYWGNENTGQVAGQNANYQLTNAVWGDTGSVIVK